MNSLELRLLYIQEIGKCKTDEERKAVCDAYNPVCSKVFKRELEYNYEHGILTEY